MDYNQKTVQVYEETAEEYAKKKAGKLADSQPFLEKFVSYLTGNSILEIGFGLGQDADWFIEHRFNYTGVDPVKKFADDLRSKHPDKNIINQDIRTSEFPKESFDGIYTMATFLHLNDPDLKKVLEKCFDWLKPGGVLFVTVKEGSGNITRDDKFFNLFTKDRFLGFTKKKFELLSFHIDEARTYNTGTENWISFYLKKI